MSDDARAAITDFVTSHNTLTLATSGPSGPWASAVFYAVDEDLTFYFKSSPSTRHGQNLADNPMAAATIQDDGQDWASIQGVQMSGTCSLTDIDTAPHIDDLYRQKFTFLNDESLADDPPDLQLIAKRFNDTPWYTLQPDKIRLIDNATEFAHKIELSLTESL